MSAVIDAKEYCRQQYPFRTVQAVTGIKAKRLRYWLDHSLVGTDARKLDSDWPNRNTKHRRFSARDAVHLALVDDLSYFGFEVREASHLVQRFMSDPKQNMFRIMKDSSWLQIAIRAVREAVLGKLAHWEVGN